MSGGKPLPMAVVTWPGRTTPGFIFSTGVNNSISGASPMTRNVACADWPPVPTAPRLADIDPTRVTVAPTDTTHDAPPATDDLRTSSR